jgi:hypothetical protein
MLLMLFMFGLGFPGSAESQANLPDISGTWRVQTPDGPQEVVIRADSSASFGDDTVRWRLVADSIHIALGDEWMVYGYELRGKKRMILSGGDLEEPMELDRIGAATARAEGVEIPPPPPADRRAIT